jgi:Flp pilus assembly protein TadG
MSKLPPHRDTTDEAPCAAARATLPTCILAASGRLWGNQRGAAAVEFAYLAPVLLLMLLGTIEMGRAINIDRHFVTATAMVGDLVAREEWLGTTASDAEQNLDGMMQSIEHVMRPYDPSSLKLAVFSVRASTTDADDTKVEWSYSYNNKDAPQKCDAYTLPEGLIGKGGSAIVVESSYLYKPLFADFVPGITGNMEWTDKSIHSPRNSCVDYVKGDNCSSLDCD